MYRSPHAHSSPDPAALQDFAIRWSGFFKPFADGAHTFSIAMSTTSTVDEWFSMSINAATLVSRDPSFGSVTSTGDLSPSYALLLSHCTWFSLTRVCSHGVHCPAVQPLLPNRHLLLLSCFRSSFNPCRLNPKPLLTPLFPLSRQRPQVFPLLHDSLVCCSVAPAFCSGAHCRRALPPITAIQSLIPPCCSFFTAWMCPALPCQWQSSPRLRAPLSACLWRQMRCLPSPPQALPPSFFSR